MGQLIFRTLVGFLAGLAAWAVTAPFTPTAFRDPAYVNWEFNFVLIVSGCIGGAVGGLNGFLRGGKVHTLRGLGLGVALGCIGGIIGYQFGGQLMTLLSGGKPVVDVDMPWRIIVRTGAILPWAAMLGLAIGGASLSPKSIRNGALGGALAGLAAGLSFDVIGTAFGHFFARLATSSNGDVEVGALARAITAVLIGGMVALFIGIVERMTRTAWLRLRLGRNEGKEWVVDMPQTFIGRSEKAHVPLFGDPGIAPMHACIVRQGPAYVLMDSGSGTGTRLNGQPIQQAGLASGDMITVGGTTLEFVTRAGAAPVRAPEQYLGQAYPLQGGHTPVQQPPVPVTNFGQTFSPAAPGPLTPAPSPMAPTQMAPGPLHPAPNFQSRGFTLVALDGPLSGKRYPLTGPTDLGRESALIPMGFDSMTSRKHARLEPSSLGIQVTDLNSTNGTFVNGQKITTQSINPGDMLQIGSTTFRVENA